MPVILLFKALFKIAVVTCAGVDVGNFDKYNAATPATCGEAIDVPDSEVELVSDVRLAEVMLEPGP